MTAVLRGPETELSLRVAAAAARAFGPEYAAIDAMVRRSDRTDFQANLAMGLAKRMKKAPRAVAEALVAALDVTDICDGVEVAGPGFINFNLRAEYLAGVLRQTLLDPRLGVPLAANPETVVIDYGS